MNLVIGNWKMNGSRIMINQLLIDFEQLNIGSNSQLTIGIAPPNIYINEIQQNIANKNIWLGAQNVNQYDQGAYTGEISAKMLSDINCQFVIVGHSERRQYFNENDNLIKLKAEKVSEYSMIPICCVGETLEQREQGKQFQVIQQQVESLLQSNEHTTQSMIIAYEPVWAIGTGKTASPNEANEIHCFINELVKKNSSNTQPILYGGSVNENNAQQLAEKEFINGFLVGGASLSALQFNNICEVF